jgi:hypothetical protein
MKRFSKNNCPNTHELTEKGNCVKKCGNSRERNTSTQRCKKQCIKSTHELTENGNCVKRCVDGKTRNQSSKRKRCKQINANTRKRQLPRKKKPSSLQSHEYQPNSGQQSSSASKDNSQYSQTYVYEGDYSPASAGPQHVEEDDSQKIKKNRERIRERLKTVRDQNPPVKYDTLTPLSSAETVASFITPEDSGEYIPKTKFTPQPTSFQKQHPPNKSIKQSLNRNIYSTNPKHNEIREIKHAKGTKFTTLASVLGAADNKTKKQNTKQIETKATTIKAQNAYLERLAKPNARQINKKVNKKTPTKRFK